MTNFSDVLNIKILPPKNIQWTRTASPPTKGLLPDNSSKLISANYEGFTFQLVEKSKRRLPLYIRIFRVMAASLATVLTFGAALAAKSVRRLFTETKRPGYHTLLIEPPALDSCNTEHEEQSEPSCQQQKLLRSKERNALKSIASAMEEPDPVPVLKPLFKVAPFAFLQYVSKRLAQYKPANKAEQYVSLLSAMPTHQHKDFVEMTLYHEQNFSLAQAVHILLQTPSRCKLEPTIFKHLLKHVSKAVKYPLERDYLGQYLSEQDPDILSEIILEALQDQAFSLIAKEMTLEEIAEFTSEEVDGFSLYNLLLEPSLDEVFRHFSTRKLLAFISGYLNWPDAYSEAFFLRFISSLPLISGKKADAVCQQLLHWLIEKETRVYTILPELNHKTLSAQLFFNHYMDLVGDLDEEGQTKRLKAAYRANSTLVKACAKTPPVRKWLQRTEKEQPLPLKTFCKYEEAITEFEKYRSNPGHVRFLLEGSLDSDYFPLIAKQMREEEVFQYSTMHHNCFGIYAMTPHFMDNFNLFRIFGTMGEKQLQSFIRATLMRPDLKRKIDLYLVLIHLTIQKYSHYDNKVIGSIIDCLRSEGQFSTLIQQWDEWIDQKGLVHKAMVYFSKAAYFAKQIPESELGNLMAFVYC